MENQDVINRLIELVKEFSGGKYSVFAKKADLTASTFRNYLTGKAVPSLVTIRRICTAYSITPNWLIFGWQPKYGNEFPPSKIDCRVVNFMDINDLSDDDFVTVPVLSPSAWSNGLLLINDETTKGFIVQRQLKSDALWIGIKMPDISMTPTILQDDIVVVDCSNKIMTEEKGAMYLVEIEDKITVRRFTHGMLIPDNVATCEFSQAPEKALGKVHRIIRDIEENK